MCQGCYESPRIILKWTYLKFCNSMTRIAFSWNIFLFLCCKDLEKRAGKETPFNFLLACKASIPGHWGVVIYDQILTWTDFAILAMFLFLCCKDLEKKTFNFLLACKASFSFFLLNIFFFVLYGFRENGQKRKPI